MDKQLATLAEAVADIPDGATIMIGGFGGSGGPVELVHALIDQGARDLTIINNNAGAGAVGIAALLDQGQVRKVICSYPRTSDPRAFNARYRTGEVELDIVPQGTLAERIRAGGAGVPAFYTPTSVGTELAEGKPTATFDGRDYVQERWLKADYALLKAREADNHGNLTYNLAARNFSPVMATAANVTIVQAESVVPLGGIHPEQVVTPGIYVDRVVHVPDAAQEEVLVQQGARYP
ncbi:3-oxoacid CoA-transferase subunit A [Aliiroseovarius sp. PTFE2010]|uniref:3-oxoacid CoA-transferase subunit A n=1 Tax=Aliiroseovarius sp. PTFE2010 TaxID=3417190 RepID=UPI003CFA0BC1